ncbi:Zinc finger protein [Nesidiocoris tenuis]|uniref:Zinc finger protein n=1 Tax=Nesidiocoris tenuis TaxID=355587 RepID=A0ABN7B147_9HEMI|nr:Zinc finger protein [Nesidiocoris tenuis]
MANFSDVPIGTSTPKQRNPTTCTCAVCYRVFPNKKRIREHIRNYHSDHEKFKCEYCKYTTPLKYMLVRHTKSHLNVTHVAKVQYTCPLCSKYISHDRGIMISHYTDDHLVTLQTTTLEFASNAAFRAWKVEMEKREACKFSAVAGALKTKNKKIQHFRCYRDGFYEGRGKGKRILKKRGSNKIGGLCPAGINISEDLNTGIVRATFQSAHVGHESDPDRLIPVKKKRHELAQQRRAAKGPPPQQTTVNRKYLLKIDKTYNLTGDCEKHFSDWTSAECWVDAMKGESSIIRFYKPRGLVMASYPDLTTNDFILVIANDAQLQMLKENGPDFICLDSTRSSSGKDLEMTTLLVIDDLGQGFPSAFMISSRSDTRVISLFIDVLTLSLAAPLRTVVLMTDTSEFCYAGWCNVMPPPEHWLFSTWHVDQAWRKNLTKVSPAEKRATVHKKIRALLEETDEHNFERQLQHTLSELKSDPETVKFGNYFEREFSKNYTSWALYTRKHCGINADANLEDLHRILKHIYVRGKTIKRLDKAIDALIRFTRDKLYDPVIVAKPRRKLVAKITDVRKKHQTSLAMTDCVVNEMENGGWRITSQCAQETYEVVEMESNCKCSLKCDDCNICIHSFRCSCIDSYVKWNICKHVHKVGTVRLFRREDELITGQLGLPMNDTDNDMNDTFGDLCNYDDTDTEVLVLNTTTVQAFNGTVIAHGEPQLQPQPTGLSTIVATSVLSSSFNMAQERQAVAEEFMSILNESSCAADLDIIRKGLVPIAGAIRANHSGLCLLTMDADEKH